MDLKTFPNNSLLTKYKQKLLHYNLTKRKLSTKNLARLCRENATSELTLVVHSEDVDYEKYFPNAFTVTKRKKIPADMHVDLYYRDLSKIPAEEYNIILCTGLLEHIPAPQRLIDELYRILKPGGRLIISASAVFSFHECPDDFFHFTPYGFRLLFKHWSEIKMLRGASQPFETIAILMQRINLQCDIFPPIRLLVELLFYTIPLLDYFIINQYDTRQFRNEASKTDSMLPSNIQAVVIK
jgi:SAM-dependent methyltransferase